VKPPDLRTFLDALRSAGELVTVEREVDPDLEIAAIADRVSKAAPEHNKALLFTNVKDSRFPVLINALGSERRMNMVCGVERREQLERLVGDFLGQLERPRTTWLEKLRALPMLGRLGRLFPRHRAGGACQEVVHEGDDVDLFELPILKSWPDDGGPMVTLPLVFTRDPESGARNCGMYRLQRYDRNTLGFHVHTHHTAAEHLRRYAALGYEHMPVAVAVGASAATVFAAVAPLPPGVDELLFAAFLQGVPVDLVRCRTVPLEVPAGAEFVIEGYVPVDEKRLEGPFGDHTGFYSLPDLYGVLHVTAVTHRRDAIWHATVVGPPPQEDCWMGAAIERLFLPLQRKLMPELIDMRLPFAGVFHNLMLLKIRKDYPGQARKVAHTVWGLGQAMFTKVVVVFDQDAPDLRDDEALLQLLLERLDVSRDLEFVLGPTETLDHASRALHFGSKLSLDLLRDTRDSLYLTRSGHKLSAGTYLSGEALGGDVDTYGISLEAEQHFSLHFDTILSFEGSMRFADATGSGKPVPIFDRLFLGGSNNLRGFDFREVGPKDGTGEPLGGQSALFFSTEYTFPIYKDKVRGALFYDAGVVNAGDYDLSTSNYNSNWGLGLRLFLPVGPIRLDFGIPMEADSFNDSGGKFNFNLGYQF
jgi:4-hydroxy-3-polyprenylbenzoate decarboxylase